MAGLALWIAAHLFKRVAPGARAALGGKGRGLVALALLVSLVLMVIGYRAAGFWPVYTPIAGMRHLNNLMMVVSIFLFGVGGTKGVLYPKLRHPMLLGVLIWALAHLLVNGDVASIVLFGTMGVWAVVEMMVINAAGPWVRPTGGRGLKGDLFNAVGTLVLVAVIGAVHSWLGYNPFTGS